MNIMKAMALISFLSSTALFADVTFKCETSVSDKELVAVFASVSSPYYLNNVSKVEVVERKIYSSNFKTIPAKRVGSKLQFYFHSGNTSTYLELEKNELERAANSFESVTFPAQIVFETYEDPAVKLTTDLTCTTEKRDYPFPEWN